MGREAGAAAETPAAAVGRTAAPQAQLRADARPVCARRAQTCAPRGKQLFPPAATYIRLPTPAEGMLRIGLPEVNRPELLIKKGLAHKGTSR
ncbi:MAG: hypothetical protein IJO10_00530 [Clostridia bacterium]|nr:hypothetical protein [Clostridia bacterium]